jgi:hypothetical protein
VKKETLSSGRLESSLGRLDGQITCLDSEMPSIDPTLDERLRIALMDHPTALVSTMRSFVTEGNYYGLCMPGTRKGDVVAILYGARVLFVLRGRGRLGLGNFRLLAVVSRTFVLFY